MPLNTRTVDCISPTVPASNPVSTRTCSGIIAEGYPPALGQAFAFKRQGTDRIAVAVTGEGASNQGAFHESLNLAALWNLPVVFLVMNNQAHGTISDLQAANFGVSYGCEFRDPEGNPYSPDFAALGQACGADGYRIAEPAELAPALRKAVRSRRPAVLDVPMVNEPVPTPGHWNIKDIYRGVFE